MLPRWQHSMELLAMEVENVGVSVNAAEVAAFNLRQNTLKGLDQLKVSVNAAEVAAFNP